MQLRLSFVLLALLGCWPNLVKSASPEENGQSAPYNFKPPNGVIPDANTAIAVAEAILKPIYGADTIQREEPFKAKLEHDVWTVTGDFHQTKTFPPKVGGVAEIKLSKSNGCVLNITHGM